MFDGTGLLSRALLVSVVLLGAIVGGGAVVTAQDDSVSLHKDDGRVTVYPTEDATIRGTSDLSAGENLSIRLQSSGDTQPRFLKTDQVTVGEDGNFSATFDFSEMSTNATFTVTVVDGSETVAEAEGEVVSEPETTTTEDSTESLVPGFGVVAAVGALVALTAGALLVGRH
ncbi:BGTF surface domain-containing protein [Haloferax sp. YSSS75]|uniref:BGTF surface domain-containing protein n=1 Tax=Haloferax sp. YSSS75 TaxID=3388564 RepID=UPI00398CFC1C